MGNYFPSQARFQSKMLISSSKIALGGPDVARGPYVPPHGLEGRNFFKENFWGRNQKCLRIPALTEYFSKLTRSMTGLGNVRPASYFCSILDGYFDVEKM